jgi:bifunctional DNA-binding transcriptional regulator/antitoxin component of YhaV-PrlF toxin-antitoxin module
MTTARRCPVSKVAISSVLSDGKVAIPEEIQEQCLLRTGERIEWKVTENGTIEIRRVGRSLDDLVNVLPPPARALTDEELDAAIGEHLAEKHRVRR